MVGEDGHTMTTTPEENEALVRRFLSDVVAGRDTAAVDTFLDEDATDHNLVFGDRQEHKDLTTLGWRVLAAADVDVEIKDIVATDQRVAVRATIAGTHRESLMDLAPTGKSFTITYAWFCRIADGRIAEVWSLPNGLGLLQQLDALPEPPSDRSVNKSNVTPRQ
jgi:predicted ester cyclase